MNDYLENEENNKKIDMIYRIHKILIDSQYHCECRERYYTETSSGWGHTEFVQASIKIRK